MKTNYFRNDYSEEFKEEICSKASDMTLEEMAELASSKYSYNTTKDNIRRFLNKRELKWKGYNPNKARGNAGDSFPIGSERIRSDGMVEIKIAPNKWMYKQRYIYEQYYNVKLTSDDFIIFLDHNRNNFDISNLKKVSRRESSVLINHQLISTNKEVTETGIEVAKLIIKIDDKRGGIYG